MCSTRPGLSRGPGRWSSGGQAWDQEPHAMDEFLSGQIYSTPSYAADCSAASEWRYRSRWDPR